MAKIAFCQKTKFLQKKATKHIKIGFDTPTLVFLLQELSNKIK